MSLPLSDYRALLALDEAFEAPPPAPAHEVPRLIHEALGALLGKERPADGPPPPRLPAELSEREGLQALLTVRPGRPSLSPGTQATLDQLLAYERAQRPLTEALDLPSIAAKWPAHAEPADAVLALWQGDITTLRVDAIVNAANSALLGCFQPFHRCIDNVIHAAAGPRLREDCERLMTRQGFEEPTGQAKLTRGYHLPARFVLHTVGPIHRGRGEPDEAEKQALAASYRACLDLAAELPAIRSLAFPCISTGVFGFPQEAAARLALDTVRRWLAEHPGRFDRVVFNVFLDSDRVLYQTLLAAPRPA